MLASRPLRKHKASRYANKTSATKAQGLRPGVYLLAALRLLPGDVLLRLVCYQGIASHAQSLRPTLYLLGVLGAPFIALGEGSRVKGQALAVELPVLCYANITSSGCRATRRPPGQGPSARGSATRFALCQHNILCKNAVLRYLGFALCEGPRVKGQALAARLPVLRYANITSSGFCAMRRLPGQETSARGWVTRSTRRSTRTSFANAKAPGSRAKRPRLGYPFCAMPT